MPPSLLSPSPLLSLFPFFDTTTTLSLFAGRALCVLSARRLTRVSHTDLGCNTAQLALAWVARVPSTSTVILGATKPEQVLDNLKALEVIPKLTPEILDKIEAVLGNKPEPVVRLLLHSPPWGRILPQGAHYVFHQPSFGRPALDKYGPQ